MDDLDMRKDLCGALAFSGGYARNSLRLAIPARSQNLSVVKSQAFASFGAAVTYDRWRASLHFTSPIYVRGDTGSTGARSYAAPAMDIAHNPDSFSDVRLGLDARILGGPDSSFRLGAGLQLFVPVGVGPDYVTDDTYRGMGRILFAGAVAGVTYAGHVGLHLRPRDDAPSPEAPRGNELLFGIAAGPRLATTKHAVVIVGPEIYGASALRGLGDAGGTALEALLTARMDTVHDEGHEVRFKVGSGGGLHPHFGAPEWRAVFSVEVVGHAH